MSTFEPHRPDPDELLATIVEEEEKSKRGKLKIFFGMCAGVGKTYSMLKAARAELPKEPNIVVGYIETHNRQETAELVDGFEIIPRKIYEYKSTLLEEMDLDAIIARKPVVVLVDELAHTNAPGSRHVKRYHDVVELLENGINVYTTLNVQHLESRSEMVAQITGVVIRETLPDEIFEKADKVELIDLPTEDLLQRLHEGKVYSEERSREAAENFFREENITALREMALRIVADRVDRQVYNFMKHRNVAEPWKSGLYFVVVIDYQKHSGYLLRWAKNLSYSLGAQIQALYVETTVQLTEKDKRQLDKNFHLAKQLGINVRINTNDNQVKAIVDFARKQNATQIIVGKPTGHNLFSQIKTKRFISSLIRYSGNIDVYVLGAETNDKQARASRSPRPAFSSALKDYFVAGMSVCLLAACCYFVEDVIGYQAVSFLLLFLVSILAMFFGIGPILLAALLSAGMWDYFFIPPYFTLSIDKPVDIMMFAMFFIIVLLNGILTSRVRSQEQKTRVREERTNALYQLTKDLNKISGMIDVTRVAVDYVRQYFALKCTVFIQNENGKLESIRVDENEQILSDNETSIAAWTFKHAQKAGKNTDTLPSSQYTYYPMTGNKSTIGVLAVHNPIVFTHGEEQFWDACLSQITGKYERELLRDAAKRTFLLSESEKLYKTLFNSISHELRIPVATIMGASDTLIEQSYPEETRKTLYNEINSASVRLNRLINNLLNMSRLESGVISPRFDWCDVHDLANSVEESLKNELQHFNFELVIPSDMQMVRLDFGLMEQALHNLILNATQNSPKQTNIRLKFFIDNRQLVISIMDRGKGFPLAELGTDFNIFRRSKNANAGGIGLGLSIVKGFVEAHKGNITVRNRQNGGTEFTITLPVEIADMALLKE